MSQTDSEYEKHQFPDWPRFATAVVLVAATVVGGWFVSNNTTGAGEKRVAQTLYDLPAFTALDETNVREIEVFLPEASAITLAEATGRVVVTPTLRDTVLTDEMLVQLPPGSTEWRVLTVPLDSTVAPRAGETVVLLGVDASAATPSAAATPVKGGAAIEDVTQSGEAVDPATLTQPEEVATEAFVLGMENGNVVLAVTPDEASRAIPYLVQKDRRLLMFRTLTTAP